MPKVTYTPGQGEAEETSQFGYHFKKGQSVEVTDEKQLAKFRGNPFFAVGDKKGDHTLEEHEERAKRIPLEALRMAQGMPATEEEPSKKKWSAGLRPRLSLCEVVMLAFEFRAALAAHDEKAKLPHTGPYHFLSENERIGALIARIDPFLRCAGLSDGKSISNVKRLELLESLS